MGSIAYIGLAALIILFFCGVAVAFYYWRKGDQVAQDRLKDWGGSPGSQQDSPLQFEKFAGIVGQIAQQSDVEKQNMVRLRLVQAGYRHKHALEIYNALRVSLALVFAAIGFWLVLVLNLRGRIDFESQNGLAKATLLVLVGIAAGYYLPAILIQNAVNKRQQALMRAFPDALDMLVSCVEAGLALDIAFRRVSEEMRAAAPELSREFQIVNYEVSAGVPRIEALRHLDKRTGLAEVRSLVSVLAQAERFGTSVAKTLRIYASMFRRKRAALAEEQAAKISPKLTIVMILFLLPCMFIIILGPASIRIFEGIIKGPTS